MKEKYRIKKNEEFQAILGQRKFFRSPSFIVYTKKKNLDLSRIGISVPKKLGNAVLRNKTKRQIRSMLDEIGYGNYDFDCIIIVRKVYFKQDYEENRKDLEKVLKHVKI
jgi:ribonuclease P protein component